MTNVALLTPMRHPRPLLHMLAKNWWLILVRGLCAILFGALTFVWPAITLSVLIILYGAYALADGVLAVMAAIRGEAPGPCWCLLLLGLLGIMAGLVTLIWPGMTALILLLVIASWALATGIAQIIGAITLRKEMDNEWLLVLCGLLSVIFGLALFVQPATGALALTLIIGGYAMFYGLMLVILAMRLRAHNHLAG